MNQLETLLNTLIKMGWKPWGKDAIKMSKQCPDRETGVIYIHFTGEERGYRHIRQLVSLESGLWRFVCMHSLISEKADIRDYREDSFGFKSKPIDPDGEYRIIRSALVPEEELGQFLLDNIIVEGLKSEQSKR